MFLPSANPRIGQTTFLPLANLARTCMPLAGQAISSRPSRGITRLNESGQVLMPKALVTENPASSKNLRATLADCQVNATQSIALAQALGLMRFRPESRIEFRGVRDSSSAL